MKLDQTLDEQAEAHAAEMELKGRIADNAEALYKAVRTFMDYAGDHGLIEQEPAEFDESTAMIRRIYLIFRAIERKD